MSCLSESELHRIPKEEATDYNSTLLGFSCLRGKICFSDLLKVKIYPTTEYEGPG
jgi:hypothetical protein